MALALLFAGCVAPFQVPRCDMDADPYFAEAREYQGEAEQLAHDLRALNWSYVHIETELVGSGDTQRHVYVVHALCTYSSEVHG